VNRGNAVLVTWIVWSHFFYVPSDSASDSWRRMRPYDTQDTCRAGTLSDRMRDDMMRGVGRGHVIDVKDSAVHVTAPDGALFIDAFICYPDTIDPRGPKAQ